MMKHFKNILPLLLISGSLSVFDAVYAQEAKLPCLKKNGGIGLTNLDKFDCQLSRAVVNDPKIKKSFEDKINSKLAARLAKKTMQFQDDIALMDSYFDQLGIDLSKNSKDVQNKCRLEVISSPKCGAHVDPKKYQNKLNILLGKIPLTNEASLSDRQKKSLFERLKVKLGETRGAGSIKKDKCPLTGSAGHFLLEWQFSEENAKKLINILQENRDEIVGLMYGNYPQLKLLNDAKNRGPEGAAFVKRFEDEIRKYKPTDGSEKEFIDRVFTAQSDNQELAKSLAFKCESFANDIENYLCGELDHLGMSTEFAAEFFEEDENDNEEIVVNREIARGFSCGFVDPVTQKEDKVALKKDKTVSDWYKKFSPNELIEPTESDLELGVGAFCEMYNCKEESVKKMPSCQQGGPVTSSDLLKLCTNEKLSGCRLKLQKPIAYLQSIEKDQEVFNSVNQSLASSSSSGGKSEKPKRFSAFYENFLGVEGTLAAEGKKITPVTVAEKKAEFVERKIEPAMDLPSQKLEKIAVVDTHQQAIAPISVPAANNDKFNTFVTPTNNNANEEFKRALIQNNIMRNSGRSASGKSRKIESDTDSVRIDEMKKLRSELSQAMNSLKGTEEEKLATVAENNKTVLAPPGAKNESQNNLNQFEKQRLEQYRQSLNSWESKLRTWQGQLTDREINGASVGNRASAPAQARNDDFARSNTASDSNSSDSNIRLTKSGGATASANGNVNGKSEAASAERGPGAELGLEVAVLNSEKLATLQKESLKNLGIVGLDSFVIKVRHQDRIYDIPVKTFNHKGKSMFVPLLNEQNKQLAKIVYDSPLFSDYRYYQAERDALSTR